MKKRISLESVFSEHAKQIRQLRRSDALLDEICGDLELLLDELNNARSTGSKENDQQLIESLIGLVEEVAARLPVDESIEPRAFSELLTACIHHQKGDTE